MVSAAKQLTKHANCIQSRNLFQFYDYCNKGIDEILEIGGALVHFVEIEAKRTRFSNQFLLSLLPYRCVLSFLHKQSIEFTFSLLG